MIESLSLLSIGVAIGVAFAAAVELLMDRRRRRAADLVELHRHQALPPVPPEAWGRPPAATGETIRLRPDDVIRPLPDRLRYRGHVLIVRVRRRPHR